MQNIPFDALYSSGAVGAVTVLIAIVLNFFLKKRKQDLEHISAAQASIIKENSDFRAEIRKDLEYAKKENYELMNRIKGLEAQLIQLMQENLELKKRECELSYEVKKLREEIEKRYNEHEEMQNLRDKIKELEAQLSAILSSKE